MTTPTNIVDGSGSKSKAKVTNAGQLVTASLSYDLTIFNELGEINTAYNFYEPKAGCNFVITGVVAVADKQVSSAASADVVIYEAASAAATTVSKVLIQTAMVQDQIQIFLPINILVNEGVYINAKTTDDDIHMTIMGYYIIKVE